MLWLYRSCRLVPLCLALVLCSCRSGDSPIDSGVVPTPDRQVPVADRAAPAPDFGTGKICDPFTTRTPPLISFIGPNGIEQALLQRLSGAKRSISILMYAFTRDGVADALVAAHKRGVKVRVVVDRNEVSASSALRQRLVTTGISVKDAPTIFEHNHTKLVLVDDEDGLVMSANLTTQALDEQRNYAVSVRDAQDVGDLRSIFEVDYNGGSGLLLPCTRLVVSPINSRARLETLFKRATQRLDMQLMYFADKALLQIVKDRAAAGLKVRVILAHPSWMPENQARGAELAAAKIEVRYLKNPEVHAKLVLLDDAALVGSQNLSLTSLERNREIGVFVTDKAALDAISAQFASDWLIAKTSP